jgi:hypothetical protein
MTTITDRFKARQAQRKASDSARCLKTTGRITRFRPSIEASTTTLPAVSITPMTGTHVKAWRPKRGTGGSEYAMRVIRYSNGY